MASSPTRVLTVQELQEKIQRTRRNKTAASSSAAVVKSQEQAISPLRASKPMSPRRIQVKNQLVKAMGGTPSPTASISPPPTEKTPSPPNSTSQKADEEVIHPPHDSSQQLESPLSSTENKMEIQSSQQFPSKPQRDRRAESETEGESNENDEQQEQSSIEQRRKSPRRSLPKWPPQPENSRIEERQNGCRMTTSRPEPEEESVIQPSSPPRPKAETVEPVEQPKLPVQTVETVECGTQTTPLQEKEITDEKASSSNRSSPTVSNMFVAVNAKSSLKRVDNVDKGTQIQKSDGPVTSQQNVPWTRSRIPSPNPPTFSVSSSNSQQKPSWNRSEVAERTPSQASIAADVRTQSAKHAVPPSRPSVSSRQTQSPTMSDSSSQPMPPWIRQRTPSPATEVRDSTSRQSASQAATRSPSPAPTDVSSQSSQQKLPWMRARTPSPASNNVADEQKAPWVRPRKSPSPVAFNEHASSQQMTSSATRTRHPSPVPENPDYAKRLSSQTFVTANSSSEQEAADSGSATPCGDIETSEQRRGRPVKHNESEQETARSHSAKVVERSEMESAPTQQSVPAQVLADPQAKPRKRWPPVRTEAEVGASRPRSAKVGKEREMESTSSQQNIPAEVPTEQHVKLRKRWPPVRTEPYSNAYKQQQASLKNVKEECSVISTTDSRVNGRQSEAPSAQAASRSTSQQLVDGRKDATISSAQPNNDSSSTVRRAPWLRTRPTLATKADRLSGNDEKRAAPAEPATAKQASSFDRTPSLPTDKGERNNTYVQSAQVRSPSSICVTTGDVTSRKAPWNRHVANAGNVTEMPSDRPTDRNKGDHPHNGLKIETDTASSSSTWAGRKRSVMSPPSRKILNEVVARRTSSEGNVHDVSENSVIGDAAKVVVSYGGAVIETPKSVSVSSVRSAFASGEILKRTSSKSDRGSNPKFWRDRITPQIETEDVGAPEPSSRSLSKPPIGSSEDWPSSSNAGADGAGNSRVQSHEPSSTKGITRRQWGQVKSPPPSWSKSAWSNGQQRSRKPPISSQFTFQGGGKQSSKSSSDAVASQRQSMQARSPPLSWIKRSDSQGDMSSIRSPHFASKPSPSQMPSDRSPPPSWVNRDVSQGDISSIRSPEWDSRPTPIGTGKESVTVETSVPPSWINRVAGEDELSPIESPQPSPNQRVAARTERESPIQNVARERVLVETVDDDSSVDDGMDHRWADHAVHVESQQMQVNKAVGVEVDDAKDGQDVSEPSAQGEGIYDLDEAEESYPDGYMKSSSKSLAQMAMDSVFALDYDRVILQTPKSTSLDDDDSAGSSPSKGGIAKSTPPDRELPDEVKAMLERSLNRSLSETRLRYDSREYEADYFSTDVSKSAFDRSGSTWDQNDISALSQGSGLEQVSTVKEESSHLASTVDAETELRSPYQSSASQRQSDEMATEEANERFREMELADESKYETEASSPSVSRGTSGANASATEAVDDDEATTSSSQSVHVSEELHEARGGEFHQEEPNSMANEARGAGLDREEPNSMAGSIFMNFGNESTIDLGNPTDTTIQFSPDSPPETNLTETNAGSPSSDLASDDFRGQKTVRFSGAQLYGANDETERQPSVSERRQAFEGLHHDNPKEPMDPLPPPPPAQDVSPPSAGARHVLRYFQPEKADETEESEKDTSTSVLDVSEEWVRRDPELEGMVSDPSLDSPLKRPPPPNSSPDGRPSWSRSFLGPDPFSKQDRDDPFMKQDDPFAASKSASGEFSADFNAVFNPFSEDDVFNFDDPSALNTDFFSPYGDAPPPVPDNGDAVRQNSALAPSRRDRRRREGTSPEPQYSAYNSELATSYHSVKISKVYDEHALVDDKYSQRATTNVTCEDRTFSLEI